MNRKKSLALLFGVLLLGASAGSTAQAAPFFLSDQAQSFRETAQENHFDSTGGWSNNGGFKLKNTYRIPAATLFQDYQINSEHQLVILRNQNNPELIFELDGEILNLPSIHNTQPFLLKNRLIYVGIVLPDIIPKVLLYDIDKRDLRSLSGSSQNPVEQLSISNDSTLSLAWIERGDRELSLQWCLLEGESCAQKTVKTFSKEQKIKALLHSSEHLITVIESGQGVILDHCRLKGHQEIKTSRPFELCSELQELQPEGELKEFALKGPYLAWAKKKGGIFEIETLDLQKRQPRVQSITERSSGDQRQPVLIFDGQDYLLSWEDYNTGESVIQLTTLGTEPITKSSTQLMGRLPHIQKTTSTGSTCNEQLTIHLWNSAERQIQTYQQEKEKNTFISQRFHFPERYENLRINLQGHFSPPELNLEWRSRESEAWKPVLYQINDREIQGEIQEGIQSFQFRVQVTDKEKQCIKSIEIAQEGELLGQTGALTEKTLELQLTEHETKLPLSTTEQTTFKEEKLEQETLKKLEELKQADPQVQELNLNIGPDGDEDGLSDSFEQYLGTDRTLKDTDGGGVHDGSEVLIHGLNPLEASDDEEASVQITNIQPRAILPQLDQIAGYAPDINKPVWFFVVDDQKNSMSIGSTGVNQERQFNHRVGPLPESYTGEVLIVATQVPNIKAASLFKNVGTVLPVYLYTEEDIKAQRKVIDLALEVDSLQFFSETKTLKTLQRDHLEVFLPPTNPKQEDLALQELEIHLEGKLFGEGLEDITLHSELQPGRHIIQSLDRGADGRSFSLKIRAFELPSDQKIQLSIHARDNKRLQSKSQVISFVVKKAEEHPQLAAILWDTTGENMAFVFWMLTFLGTLFAYLGLKRREGLLKTAALIVLVLEMAWIGYEVGIQTLKGSYQAGLITLPGQEQVIQRSRARGQSFLSLTTFDANGDLQGSLSSQWSNISPTVWEFILHEEFISSQQFIREVQRKITDHSSEQQYLSSIQQLSTISPDRLQIITRFPDPLLPQKLSKITIDLSSLPEVALEQSQLYLPLESFSDHRRLKLNENHREIPFLKKPAQYKTEILTSNPENIQHLIQKGKVDIFDDPPQQLVKTLKEQGYEIQPLINTESIVLMTNRKNFFLKNPEVISAIRDLLRRDPALLQVYPGKSQLANQFIPPGVTGYHPDIQLPSLEEKPVHFNPTTLKLFFPTQERELAQAIETILQKAGMNIIPVERESEAYQEELLKDLPGLILLPLRFDLADAGPFLDAFIDSSSPFNKSYLNPEVDQLITEARHELDQFKRLQLLQKANRIITLEDPAGIPLLFKKSFQAKKKQESEGWVLRWLQKELLGWR